MNRIGKIIIVCIVVLLAAGVALLDIPDWKALDIDKIASAAASTVLYAADGSEMTGLYSGSRREYASLSQMPSYLHEAFIAAEDERFYSHHGVDLRRMAGALWSNIRSLSIAEGASTITQQLIRMTHLSAEKTLSRKAQEIVLAIALERKMSKDEILEYYINIAYFGSGAYGAANAARRYFSKDISQLTLAQAALLAGLVKAPSAYAPDSAPEKALGRRAYVLSRMLKCGYITQEEYIAADSEPLFLALSEEEASQCGWYVDAVMEEAMEALDISAEAFLSGGYKVYTALDCAMQSEANSLFADPARFPANASDGTPVQAALTAIEPATGEVLCMTGGRKYGARRALNRATQISRQPGSAFKPVSVYAAAVDGCGYVPTDFVQDEQRDFGGGYSPGNAGGKFYGAVTLRTALAKSLNAASVDLITKVGISGAREYARRFGLPLAKADSGPSLALGALTNGVSPMQLCSAYSTLAAGGKRIEAHCIRRILDRSGALLYEFSGEAGESISEQSACILTSMLQSAVTQGSAKALQSTGFPVAAKTGTVSMEQSGNRDAWIAAYTQNVAVCIWMGFDEPDVLHCIAQGSGGSAYPARLAAAFLSACAWRSDSGEFPIAPGLTQACIDEEALSAGRQVMLAGMYTPPSRRMTELFHADAVPSIVSNIWHAPDMVWDLRVRQQNGLPVIEFSAEAGAGYRVYRTGDDTQLLIADIVADADGPVQLIDGDAAGTVYYSVVPYNAALYQEGVDLRGTECLPVVWTSAPRFFEWLGPAATESEAAEQADPLF